MEVLHVRSIIEEKIPHVLRIDFVSNHAGFKGCHSKIALDMYVSNTPTARYLLRNKIYDSSGNLVYEANPVIILSNGNELYKVNNRGVSSFFPDSWNESKILDEVEYAITNNHGKIPTRPN